MDPLSWKITNVESLICWVIFLLVMENQERFEKFVTFFNFRKKILIAKSITKYNIAYAFSRDFFHRFRDNRDLRLFLLGSESLCQQKDWRWEFCHVHAKHPGWSLWRPTSGNGWSVFNRKRKGQDSCYGTVMVIFVFYWRSNGDSSQSESSTFQGSGYLKAMEKDGCLRSQNQEQPTKWEKKNS